MKFNHHGFFCTVYIVHKASTVHWTSIALAGHDNRTVALLLFV